MLAKILIIGFVVFMLLVGLAACKVSGYWSRIEEWEEMNKLIEEDAKKEFVDED